MEIGGVYKIIRDLFGINVIHRINPSISIIDNTITQILGNNPRRLGYILMNLSANSLYISPESDPSSTKGLYLAPNGGSFVTNYREDFVLPAIALWGIAGAAASAIFMITIEQSPLEQENS